MTAKRTGARATSKPRATRPRSRTPKQQQPTGPRVTVTVHDLLPEPKKAPRSRLGQRYDTRVTTRPPLRSGPRARTIARLVILALAALLILALAGML
jgi:hypothetical protein